MVADIAVILAGYLLGSLPFAFFITKLSTGKDIRFEGDGNAGTRNVLTSEPFAREVAWPRR
jgi:glycerol-3-phosphate acyltransferase PlsY